MICWIRFSITSRRLDWNAGSREKINNFALFVV
jgi:hypothetical protein